MKRVLTLISVFALLLTACEGPQGPPGLNGLNGDNGVNFVGQSFETTINFTSTNGYQETVEIPLNIDLFETDMVLTYRFVGQVDGFDVWRLLPETVYTSNGEFQYNFEHNFDFVTIYLDAPPSFDFNTLTDDQRLDQIFRVVILPVDFVNNNRLDITNYNSIEQYIIQ